MEPGLGQDLPAATATFSPLCLFSLRPLRLRLDPSGIGGSLFSVLSVLSVLSVVNLLFRANSC